MTKNDISDIKQLLSNPKHIVIVPHKNPDGDAIGSTLGLCHYLLKYNHHVTVIAPNDYPIFLKWIPGEETVLKYDSETKNCDELIEKSDIIFTLDFNDLSRTGNMENALKKSNSIKIMIDHHQQPDDFAKYMFSEVGMSSTAEMVYHFIDMLDDVNLIDADIATCLYVGVMTDTGSFKFASTTSTTHQVIAKLIEKGANNTEIHKAVYDTNSYQRIQLLGRALNNLKVIPEARAAYITLSQNELNTFNFKKGDTEGFVNYALSLSDIVLAAIFIEDAKDGIIKISLRSKGGFSVNEMSRQHFHGGGHTNAAGGRSELPLKDTVEKFISILPTYYKALNNE